MVDMSKSSPWLKNDGEVNWNGLVKGFCGMIQMPNAHRIEGWHNEHLSRNLYLNCNILLAMERCCLINLIHGVKFLAMRVEIGKIYHYANWSTHETHQHKWHGVINSWGLSSNTAFRFPWASVPPWTPWGFCMLEVGDKNRSSTS